MKKFVCVVCGYIHEGETAPELCPVCKVGADKFEEMKGEMKWADEHRRAKELGLDAIHDTVHEMCKDEARHGKAFLGLLERHFTK